MYGETTPAFVECDEEGRVSVHESRALGIRLATVSPQLMLDNDLYLNDSEQDEDADLTVDLLEALLRRKGFVPSDYERFARAVRRCVLPGPPFDTADVAFELSAAN